MQTETRRNFFKVAGAAVTGGIAVGAVAQNTTATPAAHRFDVTLFGAKGDGKTFDTPAINQAIDAAAKAGGGTVVFPAGKYLCYSIVCRAIFRFFCPMVPLSLPPIRLQMAEMLTMQPSPIRNGRSTRTTATAIGTTA